MRIVRLLGGLGNQMWQYAFLVALKESFPEEDVYYDASFFNGYPLHNGFELDRIFNISAKQATKKDIRKVYHYFVGKYLYSRIYRHYFPVLETEVREVEVCAYQPGLLEKKGNYYYDGYWADHRYYDKFRDTLKNEFSFKKEIDERNKGLLQELKERTTCSLHVRRGDYLKDPDFAGICDKDYYRRAVQQVKKEKGENIAFLVFSNDLAWCREELAPCFGDNPVVYVDWNKGTDSYKDMLLMTKCDVNIIANSSFSWWGAYLNTNSNVLVIAPKKYKNVEMNFNIYPEEWMTI